MSKNVEINGINVGGCVYLNNSKDGLLCTLEYDYNVLYDMCCSDNPDCYYKQWQREKLKNEKLKKALNNIDKHINKYCKNCDLNKTDFDCMNNCWFTEIATPICESINEVKNERQI